ncbi:hypothetical protein RND81_01G214800 [Saponaria officinalis]|uniref:Uncharacterized protein n=1 Tax=Saponaria officinalis TaxID=3572 RepID=A0AAW1NHW4_SAPOF
MARFLYNILHIYLISIFLVTFACKVYVTHAEKKVQGMFVFGCSVVDNGNNNDKSVKGNYLPYGIDFPRGPTGRFSNGKNVADLIADHLSISRIPSFLSLKSNGSQNLNDSTIENGVNFASGASGIQEETSVKMGITSLKHQIKNFKKVVLPQLEDQAGNGRRNILGDYLFMIAAGNNDYTYYHTLHQDIIWDPLVFAAKLVSNYFVQFQSLYKLGARKFLVMSVYPVGCNPVITKKKGECLKGLNEAVDLFYEQLLLMVMQSKQDMPDADFCVVNSAKIILDIIKSPKAAGFKNVDTPCCDTMVEGTCKRGGRTCPNRKEYVFFDGLHLTEAASDVLASKAYYSDENSEIYPDNLQTLIHSK